MTLEEIINNIYDLDLSSIQINDERKFINDIIKNFLSHNWESSNTNDDNYIHIKCNKCKISTILYTKTFCNFYGILSFFLSYRDSTESLPLAIRYFRGTKHYWEGESCKAIIMRKACE